jgi:hypothetical protein
VNKIVSKSVARVRQLKIDILVLLL